MGNRINFTKAALDKLRCEAGRDRAWYHDTKVPALTVMVRETGGKSFYVNRRINGTPKRVLLGSFPAMSPEQARTRAQAVNVDINDGKDPVEAKRSRRLEMTLGDAFTDYLAKHAKVYKRERSWREDEKQWTRYMDEWKGRKLSAVTGETVAEIHRAVGKKGKYAANRLLALLSSIFTHAKREPNPCRGVTRFPEQKRERFLHPDELPAFFAAVEAEEDDTLRDFFKVALFTGARRSNVQAMRWAHVNLARGTWTIPAEEMKANEGIVIHLAAPVVAILQARRAAAEEKAAKYLEDGERARAERALAWVFPSRRVDPKTPHLAEPKGAWDRVLARGGLKDLRIHDLRRTLGSWQAMTGASLPVIGKTLGHRNQATTEIYARMNLDPVKQSVNLATAAILAASVPPAKPIASTVQGAAGNDPPPAPPPQGPRATPGGTEGPKYR
jgi:integrase